MSCTVLPTFSGVKYFCTKMFTSGGSGGILPREHFVILTSEFSNLKPLLLIFFEITEVAYILGLNHGGFYGIISKSRIFSPKSRETDISVSTPQIPEVVGNTACTWIVHNYLLVYLDSNICNLTY